MIKYNSSRLNELIEYYLDSRSTKLSAVSIDAASRAITTVMPDCPLHDRELADLIAAAAVRHGYAVSFDRVQRP
jgi:hypothetical protein